MIAIICFSISIIGVGKDGEKGGLKLIKYLLSRIKSPPNHLRVINGRQKVQAGEFSPAGSSFLSIFLNPALPNQNFVAVYCFQSAFIYIWKKWRYHHLKSGIWKLSIRSSRQEWESGSVIPLYLRKPSTAELTAPSPALDWGISRSPRLISSTNRTGS